MKNIHLEQIIENKTFQLTMLLSIFGYILFKESNRYLGDIFQTTLVLGSCLAFWIHRRIFIKDKIILLLIASIVISILSWVNSIYSNPELAKARPNIGYLGNLFFFIMIAYWLKGNLKYIRIALGLYLISILLTLITHSTDIILDITNGLNGKRIDFNFINANHSAALSGSALLIISYYLFKSVIDQAIPIKNKSLISLALIFSYIPFLFIVISTQARQVWLAIFTIFLLFILKVIFLNGNFNLKKAIFTLVVSSIILISLFNTQVIQKRILTESSIITTIASGNIDNIPYSSVGTRVHFWAESIPWVQKYPLLGFGEDTRNLVIQESNNIPQSVKNNFSHLHNGHIEILVSYGLLGFVLIALVYYHLINTAHSVKKIDKSESYSLIVMFIIYFVIINMFESFLLFKTGTYMFSIFCGATYSIYLTNNIKNKGLINE